MKRSKSVPKLSQQIQLPDSAVSGKTTGGHRHIAISIPMEASPFGLMPRSQYPVYHQTVAQYAGEPGSPVRYLNDKGVITVLRPVNEDRESRASRGSFPGFRLSIPPSPGPPPSKALPPTGIGLARSKSSGGKTDYIGVSPEGNDRPLLGDINYTVEPHSDLRANHTVATTPRRTSSAQGLYPPKTSSTMQRTSMTRPSIDGIIANSATTPVQPKKPRPISESSATEDEEPILGRSEHWPPLIRGSTDKERPKKDVENNGATVIAENPLATMDEQDTPPPTPRTTESRRDKVRNLKRRDIAALRTTSQSKGDTVTNPKKAIEIEPPGSTQEHRTRDSHERYEPTNTLSPIMVVTSIEPVESTPAKPIWNDRKRMDLEITPPGTGYISKVEKDTPPDGEDQSEGDESARTKSLTIPQARRARAQASLSSVAADKSCNPTPPLSPTRSLRRANSTLDRTSLSRRREWNANKGKARRVQDVVDAVKSKMQDNARATQALEEVREADRDQEFLKLYEAYRENRLRDMERRVRRLERHGDVWMRALVPVLDNLNRTMTSSRPSTQDEDVRGWKADEDSWDMPTRGRTKHRSLPAYNIAKRDNASAERDGRSGRTGKMEDSPRNSDDSGLDTLEPLMRELAGAAQERLKRNEQLTGIAL